MFVKIKNFFVEDKKYPCIVYNGKSMSYPHLTIKEIENIKTLPQYKGWSITIKED